MPESLTWENQASEGSAPWCEEQLFFSFSFLVSSLLPTTQPSTGGTAKAPDDKTQTALEAVHTLAVVAAVGDAKPVAASEVADTKPLDVPAEFVDKAANASSQAAPELVDTKAKASSKTKEILSHLTDSEAYFHFDFKENVRYPMSQEETGDEWHAQTSSA